MKLCLPSMVMSGLKKCVRSGFFVQGQGEDAAGHEDGERGHVHVVVDISQPIRIRIYGKSYLKKDRAASVQIHRSYLLVSGRETQ